MNQQALSMKDRLRIELAVRRVDYALDGRVPMAKRRQIRSELRSNLIEAAKEVGAENAVRQLGDLRTLSQSYLDLYRGRFDFKVGSYWAVVTYAVIQIMEVALVIAFHAGVATGGANSGTYSFQFWDGFGPFAGSVSGSGSSFVMLLLSPAHVLLMLVAFMIGSSYRTVFARR
jgi:hypothetical protein